MAIAYVIINCVLGSEEQVINDIKQISGVIEVVGTYGAYDMIVKVASDDTDKLREIITFKIRKIDNIRTTLTLMCIPNNN